MIQEFAVIFGNDHHSFPDALNRTRRLGLRHVFHFGAEQQAGYGEGGSFCFAYRLTHIDLESVPGPVKTKNHNWETDVELEKHGARSSLSLPQSVEDCCFAGAPEKSIFALSAHELAAFHKSLGQDPACNAEAIRLVIVPEWGAGYAEHFKDKVDVQKFREGAQPSTIQLKPDGIYFVSPGNCRSHVFCSLNVVTRQIRWHDCS